MKIEDKTYKDLLIFLIITIGLLLSCAIGASYADNNNKNDILKASNHTNLGKPVYLSFNLDGLTYYFNVEEITPYNYKDYVNMTLVNDTLNKTKGE